jgi:hypothetical protein
LQVFIIMRPTIRLSHAVFVIVLLAGCATATHPVAYKNLASAQELAPNTQDTSGHVPYIYTAKACDWSRYHDAFIDPVVIYQGNDQQFGKLSEADKAKLANYMQSQLSQTLQSHFVMVSKPNAQTLRIHVTLTGAETNVPVVGTVRQLMPWGAVISTVQSAADKQGRGMGSISYAVEIYDGSSNRLLRAYVSKQYPAAEDIPASVGALSASEIAIRKGVKALPEELE